MSTDSLVYLKKLQEWSRNTAEVFKLYFEKLESSGFSGVNPYLSEKITSNLGGVLEDTKTSKKLSGLDALDFKKGFSLFVLFKTHAKWLNQIYQVAQNRVIDISRAGTTSSSGQTLTTKYLTSLNETYQSALDIYQAYHTEISRNTLQKIIVGKIPKIQTTNEVDQVTKLYLDYVNEGSGEEAIDLYAEILQDTLDSLKNNPDAAGGKKLLKYVLHTLETIKTQVLDVPRDTKTPNRQTNIIQYLIQWYNLIPDKPSRSLAELIRELGVDIKEIRTQKITDVVKHLKQVAKLLSAREKKFGFMLWYKVIPRPIEHNLWTLISERYVRQHDYIQSAEVGINAKMIERNQTIRLIKPTGSNHIEEAGITVVNDEFTRDSDNYYFIMESLDGENYRLLIPWHISEDPRYSASMYIPEKWIGELNNEEATPSRRLESYNTIINQEIINNLEKPFVELEQMSRADIQREELYWKNLRVRIRREALKQIEKIYSSGPSNRSFSSLLETNFYTDLLIGIIEQIQIDTVKTSVPADVRDAMETELLLSYYREMDYLRRSLIREINETYKRDYAKSTGNSLNKGKMSDIIGLILDEVLEKYISRRSSIYLTIQKKFAALSRTLLKERRDTFSF